MSRTGPRPLHSLPAKAIPDQWSCSKPSQPSRCSREIRRNADHVSPASMSTNGDAAKNARAASAADSTRRRRRRQPTTTSGTSASAPGYFAAVARPIATPAHSSRPVTRSASATVTSVVSGTSVTAACENATCVVSTAVIAAATAPATTPYAADPSHHAAATPPSANATITNRPARYDGAACHAWNGATAYVTSVGQSKKCGSRPRPWVIRHARGTTFCSSGLSSEPYGSPYWMPTSRNAAAPARIAARAARGPPQFDPLDGRGRATDELGDIPRRNDHGVDAAPLELHDLAARDVRRLGDRELPDGNVRQQLERTPEVVGREMERLGIVLLENPLEHLVVRDADDEVEPQLGGVRGGRVEIVAVVVTRIRHDEDRVRTGAARVVGRAAAAPEDRKLGRLPDSGERTAHHERLGAVGFRSSGRVRSVHVDDHRDAVAFGNRLAESSRAPFQEREDRISSGTLSRCAHPRPSLR